MAVFGESIFTHKDKVWRSLEMAIYAVK